MLKFIWKLERCLKEVNCINRIYFSNESICRGVFYMSSKIPNKSVRSWNKKHHFFKLKRLTREENKINIHISKNVLFEIMLISLYCFNVRFVLNLKHFLHLLKNKKLTLLKLFNLLIMRTYVNWNNLVHSIHFKMLWRDSLWIKHTVLRNRNRIQLNTHQKINFVTFNSLN